MNTSERRLLTLCLCAAAAFVFVVNGVWTSASLCAREPHELFKKHCFGCHEGAHAEGRLDLAAMLQRTGSEEPRSQQLAQSEATLVFENIATRKMPPADAEAVSGKEPRAMLAWLADQQQTLMSNATPHAFRRINRREFVHSVNDLLGTNVDLIAEIPEDRGTHRFDTDRRIPLSREVLGSYFVVVDKLLEAAFPEDGFPQAQTWVTNKLKDSHETYRIYVRHKMDDLVNSGHGAREPQGGAIFSWTRANNGNSYSFFYDNFDPPVSGWYELTFEAAKVGVFNEDVSVQVHAGRYYYADDRPQPQRLLAVISLGNRELKPFTRRVFLNPGENVSVHCYSKHTWRQSNPQQGAYIRQLRARGPLQDQWPPSRYEMIFGGLPWATAETVSTDEHAEFRRTKVTVDSDSPDDLKRVIQRFAERAFSTKLGADELRPYLDVAEASLQKRGDFVSATKAGLKAVLCSPRFLMAPGEHSTPAQSQAARLSRILWLSTPDAPLWKAANASGALPMSESTLRSQVNRMLADHRSERMVESLCDQWLNFRSWDKVSPSLKLYPRYDDLLHHYLPIETRMYLAHLIRANMPVGHLIDSDYTFLNQRLAQHYGIQGITGQQMRKVTLGADIPRGGLLTMGGVLKVTTDGFDTSPILRGAWVSKNLVGTPLSPPPVPVKAIEPAHQQAATTLREQIERHKTSPSCYGCHKSIDPYGFALESFDATGQWRENYRVEKPHRGTFQFRLEGYFREAGKVDSSGEISGRRFEDVFALKKLLLSDHRRVGYNFAKQFFEYANGYSPNLRQRVALLAMLDASSDECRMKDLVTDVLAYSLSEQPYE